MSSRRAVPWVSLVVALATAPGAALAGEPAEPTLSPPGATAPRPAVEPAADTGPAIRPETWAVLGLGGFGVGLGTAFLIKAGRTEDAIRAAPAATDDDLRALRALEDRGDTEKTTGVVMLMIGSAAVLGGAAMVALDLARDRDVGVAVAPTADGGFAISAGGRF